MDDARSNKACTSSDGARIKELTLERGGHVSLFKAMAFECKGPKISKRKVKAVPHQVSRYRTARRMFLMLATFPRDFLPRRMTSAEGFENLQIFLILCGLTESHPCNYIFHFLKRTLLDFSSALGAFAFKVRPCWDTTWLLRSELTYSSDEMSRFQAKLY